MRAMLLLCLITVSASASDVTTKFEIVKVADGVYAFIAPEGRSGLVNGNSVAIVGDDGVVVVDTGQIPSLTKRMIEQLKTRTDKPVRYVVNTHWHWDHNLANFVWADAYPGVRIVSTPFTRQMLVDSTPKLLEFFGSSAPAMVERIRKRRDATSDATEKANLTDDLEDFESGLPEVRAARFVAPNETFDRALTIHLGKREVRVFHPGRANTAGDLVVHVPDAKVLITGDIVVAPTPYATSSYFADWIAVLKSLSAMDVVAIVPAHGPVQRDKAYMTSLIELLSSLVSQVSSAVRDGLSLEETRRRVDLETFRVRFAGDDRRRNRAFHEYFLTPAVETAWRQARGEETKEKAF